ncbi:MAG: DUF5106 domain-containing protein, partial [Bacteroidia bacterium]|nr:DUF5106 domain-containing protein [Bacteroidia bacterium]
MILGLPLLTIAQKQYEIKGKILGVKDTLVFLGNHYGEKQYLKDTAQVNSAGEFVFDGTEKLPGGIYLVIMPGKRYFEILISDSQFFSFETDTTDLVKTMKIKGSEENRLFYEYLRFLNPKGLKIESIRKDYERVKDTNKDSADSYVKQITEIDKEVKKYKSDFIAKNPKSFISKIFKAMEDPEVPEPPKLPDGKPDSVWKFYYFRAHYFDGLDLADDRMLRTPIYHQKLKYYLDKLIPQTPDSLTKAIDEIVEKARPNPETFKYVIYWTTYTYETSNIMGFDAIFVHLVNKYYKTKQ